MTSKRALLLSTALISMAVIAVAVGDGAVVMEEVVVARAQAACQPSSPCAGAKPCGPCAAGAPVELSDAEATAAYDCLLPIMTAGYQKSGRDDTADYTTWRRYSRRAYVSETHGSRYVQNYANATAKA